MIKNYNIFLNEKYENKEVDNMHDKLSTLIENGDIVLGNDNKTVEDILKKIYSKKQFYPRFGFEDMILSFENGGKGFISEADKDRMGEYINRIKELGIDCTKLEELLPMFMEYRNIYNEEEKHQNDEKELEKIYKKETVLKPKADRFVEILRSLSDEIISKL